MSCPRCHATVTSEHCPRCGAFVPVSQRRPKDTLGEAGGGCAGLIVAGLFRVLFSMAKSDVPVIKVTGIIILAAIFITFAVIFIKLLSYAFGG